MSSTLAHIAVLAGLALAIAIAWFAGRVLGRRIHAGEVQNPQLGVVQGAILALLGLLLGFCFSGAMTRFVERQDIIVREANAISTAYLRADLLDPSSRDTLRATLRDYGQVRLRLFEATDAASTMKVAEELGVLQQRIWQQAVDGVRASPGATMAVLPPVNEVFDLLATRNASTRRHVPVLVFAILVVCSMAGVACISLGHKPAHTQLRMPGAILSLLITAALWTTLDLDFPRAGLVRISDQPLRDMMASLQPAGSVAPAPPAGNDPR